MKEDLSLKLTKKEIEKIDSLTKQWFDEKDKKKREIIHQQAEDVRNKAKKESRTRNNPINMRNPDALGKGASAKIEDRVKMYYTETYYFNGQKYESQPYAGRDAMKKTAITVISQVLPGWTNFIPLKTGDKAFDDALSNTNMSKTIFSPYSWNSNWKSIQKFKEFLKPILDKIR